MQAGVNWAIVVPISDGENSTYCQSAGLSVLGLGHRVGASGTICWNGKRTLEHTSGKRFLSSLQACPTSALCRQVPSTEADQFFMAGLDGQEDAFLSRRQSSVRITVRVPNLHAVRDGALLQSYLTLCDW
eukprot:CAMPEP_0115530078 /NCGR_PEP_ID=MMETSP0271-20121206/84298_1 /TAXON_ID=71861 /ORGANISM="Scrippsiella trochoidea, Strain CCMP3099" /LENGTH=129 /DNA_ID=CAMNT_0002962173 /DNA_START=270 /DNA_END=656 /DNA_ORIENTATION=-